MTKDQELRLALEEIRTKSVCQTARTIAKDALRKALEQPEPEPVAWGVDWGNAGDSPCVSIIKRLPDGVIEVVAVECGPKRKPLTDEQIKGIYEDCDAPTSGEFTLAFVRAIEAAHGIKGEA